MKFIDINSVRGLEIDQPVFVKGVKDVGNGGREEYFGFGKLVKEEKTAKGIIRTFDIALFIEDVSEPIDVEGNFVTTITHVCIPK